MSDTLAALAAAIIANPTDRTVRLVFADALDESCDPANAARAEFIRAQIALETTPEANPQRSVLIERCDKLFAEYWIDWWRPVCHCMGLPEPYTPRRRVRDRMKRFIQRDKRALGAPYIHTSEIAGVYSIRSEEHRFTAQFIGGFPELLYFHDSLGLLDRWACAIPFARLRWVGNGFNDESWQLLDAPHVAKVSQLILDRVPPSAVGVARSRHLSAVTTLKVQPLNPAEYVVREFVHRPAWAGLRSLTLCGITPPDAIQTLAEQCTLEKLESLSLGICEVPERPQVLGMIGTIGAMISEVVTHLFNSFSPPGPIRWPDYWPALTILARSPVLPRLRRLQLIEANPQTNPLGALLRGFDQEDAPSNPDTYFPDSLVKAVADGLNPDMLEKLELPQLRLSVASRAELVHRFGSRAVLV